MRKNSFKRIAASVLAVSVIAGAMPVMAVPANAASNLISNSTFESGTTDWGTYKESGGSCTLGTDSGRLALHIGAVGQKNYSVQMFYDIVPLYKNGIYRLKYDISCTTNRFVEGMIQQNGGTYQAYTWKGLNISPTPQSVSYEFTMEEETDIMAKLVFNCGLQEADGNLGEHTIFLDNVSLELLNPEAVDTSVVTGESRDININQVGYKPDSKKIAVFRNVKGASEFAVVNADTNQTVYTGSLSGGINNPSAGETNCTGDFSKVTTPGKYYIKCAGMDNSYTFEISENVNSNLLDDSVKMLYLQRCGTSVQDAKFGHTPCHTGKAKVYGTNDTIDVSGGWHDAGDYGRYVVPGAKAVADIIYGYQAAPKFFGDNTGIPESGNGTPDVLDEARFELEWMLKMQRNDGGVYHKVTCANFPGYVAPQAETDQLIATPVSTTATADFCGAMALAYEFYKPYDASFANKCLAAAEKAWGFLQSNPNFIFQNPSDITTGEYGDRSDKDERYWAAAQLYRATGDSKYLSALDASGASIGLDWATVGDYGNIALLTDPKADKSSNAYAKAKAAVLNQAETFAKNSQNSPYGVALTKFEWGSNMTVANAGIILGLAYNLTGEQKYMDAAEAQTNYLLGTNPLATCFMTGYGTVSPQNPHHRPSMAAGSAMKGMLVGGVNSNLEDSAAKAYCNGQPAAKCYIDNSESYSTNEICIYWNSPLTYLVSLTDGEAEGQTIVTTTTTTETTTTSTTTTTTTTTETPVSTTSSTSTPSNVVWGDADDNGSVSIADIVAVLQYVANKQKYPLDDAAVYRCDVYNHGDGLSANDAFYIQMFDAKEIDKLPYSYMEGAQPQTTTTTEVATSDTTTTTTNAPVLVNGIPDLGTPMNQNATAVADFRKGETPLFFASDGWSNGSCFDCWWYKKNTSLDNGVLSLTIDKDWAGKANYSGAEYRTADHYGFGYYETSMQAIKNDGVVSSFFTYTGPSENNPWDEVDIEILGKDTTKVQLNYYKDGVGKHEFMYDLGFDSSEAFHTYGFDWQADHITWYVDGKPVHTMYGDMPVTESRIMMNTWPGTGVNEWLNAYDGKTPLTARYQWVTYNKQ